MKRLGRLRKAFLVVMALSLCAYFVPTSVLAWAGSDSSAEGTQTTQADVQDDEDTAQESADDNSDGQNSESSQTQSDGTIEGEFTSLHNQFPCPGFGGYNTVKYKGVNGDGSTQIAGDSRFVNYCYYSAIGVNGKTYVFKKARNILNSSDKVNSGSGALNSAAGMILPQYMLVRDYWDKDTQRGGFGADLVDWGKSQGYDWTDDTEFEDMSLDMDLGCTFTRNGEPADLIDTSQAAPEPYSNYWWGQRSALMSSKAASSNYYAKSSSLMTEERDIVFSNEDGSGTKARFKDMPGMEMIIGSSLGNALNPSYRGNVTINLITNFTFTFTVDGQKYKVTVKNPTMDPTFKVQDSDRHKSIADGDVSATVTSQRADGTANTRTNTESDKVTGVMRGDSIDYKVDITTALERQMLCYLYTSLAINDISDEGEAVDLLAQMGVAFPQPYFNTWSQPALTYLVDKDGNILDDDGNIVAWKSGEGYVDEQGNPVDPYRLVFGVKNLTKPELHVSFTLPDSKDADGAYNLQYAKENLDEVSISNSRSDGIKWRLDKNSLSFDESTRTISFDVYISPKDIGQTVSMYDDEIRDRYKDVDIGSGPSYLSEKGIQIVKDTLEKMDGNNVTMSIPGVKVSGNADIGEAFTAKAKVSGDMFYGTSPHEGIMGTSAPLGSPRRPHKKPSSSAAKKAQRKAAEAMADEMDDAADTGAISALDTESSEDATSEPADDSSTADEYELWTPDQYVDLHDTVNLYDYDNYEFVFGNYYWKHLQNDDGKDCIQNEANSEEMWYTVMIPSTTVSKKVTGSAADKSGSFSFQVKLADPNDAPTCNGVANNAVKRSGDTQEAVSLAFDETGTASFELKDGESMEIVLPFGAEYTVSETSGEDYTTKIEGDGNVSVSGKSLTDTIDDVTGTADLAAYKTHNANFASFTNNKEEPPTPSTDEPPTPSDDDSVTPEKGTVTVTKKWDDNNDEDGTRPESIKVQLFANGNEAGSPVTLSASGNWTYQWTDLDKADASTGKDIEYTVKEVDVPDGYVQSVSYGTNSATITNSNKPVKEHISAVADKLKSLDEDEPYSSDDSEDSTEDEGGTADESKSAPDTGDPAGTLLAVSLIALALAGGVGVVAFRRRRDA